MIEVSANLGNKKNSKTNFRNVQENMNCRMVKKVFSLWIIASQIKE
jgi:hypothetical protein